jgi:steroid delta-isomerase-like uncharacterized protein
VSDCPQTAEKEHVMLTADIERMLDEWAIAWSSSANTDPERVLALFADDGMYEDVTSGVVVRGKEDLRRYLIGAFAPIPDFTFGVLRQFAAGLWAVIEWTMSGTNRVDWAGMPATGRRFASVRGTSILELEAGKIRRQSDYWDAATVMKQVGLLPSR